MRDPHRRVRGRWLAILLSAFAASSGCSRIAWRPDLGGAMQFAARQNRIVVVAYWSMLNDDCAWMEQHVFRSPEVARTMAGTIPVRLDSVFHADWARQMQIGRVPAFVVYAPDGTVLRRHEGRLTEPEFRAFVVAASLSR